ncbi:collagen-like protein [Dawidia soli]|uniref:Collagen-like protein n=1 Tax=Dawidia soli TaxID=2782352 RepID=A0AAP2D9E0_9BACT|nr:collagen-like protein [Dawidia soli]MBT1686755.1 hypothetical protein [Dawidia soli]
MKNPLKFFTMLLVALAAYVFTGCAEDGDPGPAGEQGEAGGKGENGKDGEDGVGFEEATRYGNVTLSLEGHRPDAEAFKKDLDFKFTPVGVNGFTTSSVVYTEGTDRIFTVRRFYSSVAQDFQDNQVTINLYVSYDDDKPVVTGVDFYVRTVITTDDYKFFVLQDSYSQFATSGDKEYTYDPATGNLELKLSFTVPGDFEFNPTGHDLNVMATVKVKVFESV